MSANVVIEPAEAVAAGASVTIQVDSQPSTQTEGFSYSATLYGLTASECEGFTFAHWRIKQRHVTIYRKTGEEVSETLVTDTSGNPHHASGFISDSADASFDYHSTNRNYYGTYELIEVKAVYTKNGERHHTGSGFPLCSDGGSILVDGYGNVIYDSDLTITQ